MSRSSARAASQSGRSQGLATSRTSGVKKERGGGVADEEELFRSATLLGAARLRVQPDEVSERQAKWLAASQKRVRARTLSATEGSEPSRCPWRQLAPLRRGVGRRQHKARSRARYTRF